MKNKPTKTTIDINDVEELEVSGVDTRDYPDFSDAYFSYGEIDERPLTDDELTVLGDEYPEVINEMAYESLI